MEELWRQVIECEHCGHAFDTAERVPLLLTCGHTLCRSCCSRLTAVCPIDQRRDIREQADISVSEQHMRAVLRSEPGCYWHIQLPGRYYCPDNFVSACESCKEERSDWEWLPLCDIDLSAILMLGIEKLCEDPEFKEQVYESDAELKNRMRNRHLATAREKQRLYFNLLSYRDQQDYRTPDSSDWPYAFCRENQAGEWEIKRFGRMLPSKYTVDFEKVQLWRVDHSHQVEAVAFTISIETQLCGVWLGRECSPHSNTLITSIILLPGLHTGALEGWVLAQQVPYIFSRDSLQEVRLSAPLSLSANTPYTLKVQYSGTGVYYGDPLSRTEVVRGPQGLEVRFQSAEFRGGDYQNGEGRRSGPIIGLTLRPISQL